MMFTLVQLSPLQNDVMNYMYTVRTDVTFAELRIELKISTPSLQQLLTQLIKRGYIKKTGIGQKAIYSQKLPISKYYEFSRYHKNLNVQATLEQCYSEANDKGGFLLMVLAWYMSKTLKESEQFMQPENSHNNLS